MGYACIQASSYVKHGTPGVTCSAPLVATLVERAKSRQAGGLNRLNLVSSRGKDPTNQLNSAHIDTSNIRQIT